MQSQDSTRICGFTFLFMIVMTVLFVTVVVKVEPAYAQFDFEAFLGKTILDEEIDGIIGNE